MLFRYFYIEAIGRMLLIFQGKYLEIDYILVSLAPTIENPVDAA